MALDQIHVGLIAVALGVSSLAHGSNLAAVGFLGLWQGRLGNRLHSGLGLEVLHLLRLNFLVDLLDVEFALYLFNVQ